MNKFIILILCIFLVTGCNLKHLVDNEEIFSNNMINKNEVNDVTYNNQEYQDENPIILSLYVDGVFSSLDKVPNDFHEKWIKKKDIAVFGILLTDEDSVTSDYFQDAWKKYADNYDFPYKVGWYISFKLTDGTKYEKMIYSPKDVEEFYDYLEIYLYDSANAVKDVWYSHLLEKNMTDKTIMTSMKLTAGSKYEEITSPITVMAYTYDSEDDFDENGFYRGNSKYLVNVYND